MKLNKRFAYFSMTQGLLFGLLLSLPAAPLQAKEMLSSSSPSQYVNPFIGTANFGATHPGAQYPHALLSVAPFNVAFGGKLNTFDKDAAWNSRVYVKENQFLTGFSHVN